MEILKKLKFSRRHALRGMVSGHRCVPVRCRCWRSCCNESGTAFAQGAPLPTTFGIFFWGNGIHPGSLWTPSGTGDGNAWQLPGNLQDFANLKDYMTLVTGLDMLDAQFKGHGWGVVYVLAGGDGTICNTTADISKSPYGGLPETSRGTQWQPTIDQLVANAIHKDEPYKSLETGILKYTGINMGTASLNLAHLGRTCRRAGTRSCEAFQHLVRHGHANGVADPISDELRRSVLDAVLADAKRLQIEPGSATRGARRSHGERPCAGDAHSTMRAA